jgi:RNA polymerase sigma-70 factor (ECF subfamily)
MSAIEVSEPERLIARSRAGEREALGQLLECYRNYLTILARLQVGRKLQGKVDAADMVQEAFLEAHRDFAGFRGHSERELVAWLRRILSTNLANSIRHYHGTKRRDLQLERELSAELARSSSVLDCGLIARQSSPSQQAARRERAVILADAIQSLNEDYRETIVLRHLEGLSFPEVAKRMGRTEDSVKKLWARALVRLRLALEILDEP